MNIVDKFTEIRDKLRLTRTSALVYAGYLNWEVYHWVMREVANKTITEEWMASGILGASGALAVGVLKFYTDHHRNGQS